MTDINFFMNILKGFETSMDVKLYPPMMALNLFVEKNFSDENGSDENGSLELSQKEIEYLEFVSELFKPVFWEKENTLSLKSNLIGPYFYLNKNEEAEWITINLSPGENRYLISKVFALYDCEKKNFYYVNSHLKNLIYNNQFFEKSSFNKTKIIKNINESIADDLALHFRTGFYESNFEFKQLKTNNLIKIKTENQTQEGDIIESKYYNIYTLIDYGVPEPEYESSVNGEINSCKLSDILSLYRLGHTILVK